MGSSVRHSVSPPVDTILSLLLQLSRDFNGTFQLLFPLPGDDHVLLGSGANDLLE